MSRSLIFRLFTRTPPLWKAKQAISDIYMFVNVHLFTGFLKPFIHSTHLRAFTDVNILQLDRSPYLPIKQCTASFVIQLGNVVFVIHLQISFVLFSACLSVSCICCLSQTWHLKKKSSFAGF